MKEKMIVVRVERDYVYLSKIEEDFSCQSCALKNICNRTDATIKALRGEHDVKVGDEVIVDIPYGISTKASLFFYTLPLVVFLTTLVASKILGLSDLASFVIGIVSMGAYYSILKFLDSKLSEKFKPKVVNVEPRSFSTKVRGGRNS